MNQQLTYIKEPTLEFGNGNTSDDPRDGLLLYGPYESLHPYKVKAGVIGTTNGLKAYESFVTKINRPIISRKRVYKNEIDDHIQRPSYPGFQAVFNIKWNSAPDIRTEVTDSEIDQALQSRNKKTRTDELVNLFLSKIVKAADSEDETVNIWFVIVPRKVFLKARPNSPGTDISAGTKQYLNLAKSGQLDIFDSEDEYRASVEKLMDSSSDFHNLLKAKLILANIRAATQVIVESTLNFRDKLHNKLYEDNIKAHIAWTLSTSIYYKLGNLPWKLHTLRNGVCYLGLVFKQLPNKKGNVCSAAQMFLKDGDGSVFRGNIGLWKADKSDEYHLDKESSSDLLALALDDYFSKWGKYPVEIFIHGKVKFNQEEWSGFQMAIDNRNALTRLGGVIIKDTRDNKRMMMKLFKSRDNSAGNYGNLRGLACLLDERSGYLFTRGFIPRLNTSNTLEIANPLYIEIFESDVPLETVLTDILALTKLNYNSCIYGDGLPVTLRFSNMIGNILTSTENWKTKVRQFRHYI